MTSTYTAYWSTRHHLDTIYEDFNQIQNSYFTDGVSSTKAGMIDYIFNNEQKYLLIDEIDKMSTKDQTFLLNLLKTEILSDTKHGKTRTIQMKTCVLAGIIR
jgi:MoxR-like ATPase